MMMSSSHKNAFRFIVLLGIVSLFADITYEGARSITGAYLAVLGASATTVGFIAGFSEMLGYALRFISGYFADQTRRYWFFTIAGYIITLLAVPLLSLANQWYWVAVLIMLERTGKAIRGPAKDTLLSYAGEITGMGWGFGIHNALDQIGGMLGPFVIALVLYFQGSYQEGFAFLGIPACFAILSLIIAYRFFPQPSQSFASRKNKGKGITSLFWIAMIGALFIAAGYADFPLMAYHFEKTSLFSPTWIPIAYGTAMGVDALFSPLLGRLYDRYGLSVLIIITCITPFFAPLVFLGNKTIAFTGVILWAIGIGAHDFLLRAFIGDIIEIKKRGTAYGIFNMTYGIAWFLGSLTMGFLYDYSLYVLVIFILLLQLASLPWLLRVKKLIRSDSSD